MARQTKKIQQNNENNDDNPQEPTKYNDTQTRQGPPEGGSSEKQSKSEITEETQRTTRPASKRTLKSSEPRLGRNHSNKE